MTILPPQRGLARSLAMQDAVRNLEAAISSSGGVLVVGESGSGRELIARAIHHATHDEYDGSVERLLRTAMRQAPNGRPFVVIDCSAVERLEEQLFGLKGAHAELPIAGPDRVSETCAIAQALGGTLVLRHLPEMPARLQLRLTRILRDDEVLLCDGEGRDHLERVKIRPIATKEKGAGEHVVPDLLRRVGQTRIELPALRDRREDIPTLVRYLLVDICNELHLPQKSASSQAVELLSALPWRGNISELRDLLRRLVLKTQPRLIRLADVLAHVNLEGGSAEKGYTGTLRQAREQFERDYVQSVLQQHRGRMAEAAKALGLQRTNLYRKVRQLSVKRSGSGERLS